MTYADDPRGYWTRRGLRYYEQERDVIALATTRHAVYLSRHLVGPVVVEIGCGYGRLLRPLASFYDKTWSLIGVDFSQTQLDEAARYLANLPRIRLLLADAAAVPQLRDREASTVYTMGAMMHIPPNRIERVLTECRRLAPRCVHIEETQPTEDFIWVHNYAASYRAAGYRRLAMEPMPAPVEASQALRCEVFEVAS